ncbi:MAG: protein-glutamate O-methyltransferase CheR, partial [Oleibacter sp.]|nr:protein-glutamate O-methyltransferase CheR [Thalassolituus sp.]
PAMDDVQFSEWQALLEERTGMHLPLQRRSFMQTSISLRMSELGILDYNQYRQLLNKPEGIGAAEWYTLVDRLTVQETRFFRDTDALQLVTEFIRERQTKQQKALNIWSLGCSSGEEAYTLAMTALQTHPECEAELAIVGTDVSLPALKKAREGRYSARSLLHIPMEMRHWTQQKPQQTYFEVNDNLRRRCCFNMVNVLDLDSYPLNPQDIIYCQNLLIYFRRWRRREILNEAVKRLAPGGLLVLGLGEMNDWHHPQLERLKYSQITAFRNKANQSEWEKTRR